MGIKLRLVVLKVTLNKFPDARADLVVGVRSHHYVEVMLAYVV